MVMKIEGDFDVSIYDDIERNIRELPRKYQEKFRQKARNPIRRLRRRVRRPPRRKPAHPFQWSKTRTKQQRARRWWFAAIAGRIPGVRIPTSGGRYRRTGNMQKRTKVVFNKKRRTITLTNDAPGNIYVIGSRQVPSHRSTGWETLQELADAASVEFIDASLEAWDIVTDEVLA